MAAAYEPRSCSTRPSAAVAPMIPASPARQRRICHRQPLANELLGVVEAGLVDAQPSKRDQRRRDVRMSWAKQGLASSQRELNQRVGPGQLPEFLVDAAEREIELRLRGRLGVQASRFDHAAIQERDDAQAVRGTGQLVATLEQDRG